MKRLLLLCLVFLNTCTGSLASGSPGDVLVRAESWQILRSEVEAALKRIETELFVTGRVLDEDELSDGRQKLLERLIFARSCLARATDQDRATGESEVREFIAQLIEGYGEDGYRRLLSRAGYTEASFAEEKRIEATVTAFVHRQLRSEVKIPSTDIRTFYERNPDRFKDPAVAKANILVISTLNPATGEPLADTELAAKERLARRIIERVKAGDDFVPLVQRYSDSELTRENGGEMRFLRGMLPPEIEGAAFSMEPGQISDVIPTELGLHIIRLIERTPARTQPIEAVEDEIRELLTQREIELRIPEFAQRLRREQKVEVTDAGRALK